MIEISEGIQQVGEDKPIVETLGNILDKRDFDLKNLDLQFDKIVEPSSTIAQIFTEQMSASNAPLRRKSTDAQNNPVT